MNKTSIDWPSLAYSWNPIVGCANGCDYCYARKISNRFKMIPDFGKPVYFPNRLEEPLRVKNPSTIFVGSMCDIFSKGVSDEWIHNIISIAIAAPWHIFMFLTKKPEQYNKFHWPVNCWLGTTVEFNGVNMRLVHFQILKQSQKDIKTFASVEPILGNMKNTSFRGLDLVIIGADSSKGAKVPPLEWVKSIEHPNIWYKQNLRKHYPELQNKISL